MVKSFSVSESGLARTKIVIVAVLIFLGLFILTIAWFAARKTAAARERSQDLGQIQSALKIYHDENGFYPYGSGVPEDFNAYLDHWPTPPTPAGVCSKITDVYYYSQKSGGADFNLTFCLNQPVSGIPAGVHVLSSLGIK